MSDTLPKILVVQSRITEERTENERSNYRRSIGTNAEISFLSSLDEKLAWNTPAELLKGYDGVIFGGSSDFDFHGGRQENDPARLVSMIILSRAKNIVAYALSHSLPTLGVCFGHQIIAQMHGGQVTNDLDQSKSGAHLVRLTGAGKRDPLLRALPAEFYAQYTHKDSVTKLPEGATILATGSSCKFSALRYGPMVYTFQFHPEVERFIATDTRETRESSKLVQLWIERIVQKRG